MHIASIIAQIDGAIAMLPEHIPDGPAGWQARKLRDSLMASKQWAKNIQREQERAR